MKGGTKATDRAYILYDARAYPDLGGDTDRAWVYACADSLSEAREDRDEYFTDGVIYSYLRDAKGVLTDERFEE